jgi:hypothetical protein
MKLQVRMMQGPCGPYVALCDEMGDSLPMQRAATFDCSVDNAPSLTVTFTVDGREISVVPSAT